ncbi:polysaccharide deacetylase [Sporosarcina sp. BI001-red]|nr:polysaccharide deacetylase family protein [Sporosarcina sp. BI001-red]REB06140.1 polysaccharide deacetylase [Sporosarcina sp. BI001-red]
MRYLAILFVFLFATGFFIGKTYSVSEPSATLGTIKKGELPIPKLVAPIIINPVEKESVVEKHKVDHSDLEEKPVGKVVYLTFDDGPSRLTNQFLDVLSENDVLATFFMQGSNLKKEILQDSVRRAVKEDHYVGGHSMTHNYKTLYTNQQFVPEMKETLNLIHEITGTTPHLVRPPYGSAPGLQNEKIRQQLENEGIKIWDWTIDSNDWKLRGKPSQIIENIKGGTTRDREVVLMHEKPQTLAALPEIIQFYKEQGYKFGVYDDEHHFVLNFQNDDAL